MDSNLKNLKNFKKELRKSIKLAETNEQIYTELTSMLQPLKPIAVKSKSKEEELLAYTIDAIRFNMQPSKDDKEKLSQQIVDDANKIGADISYFVYCNINKTNFSGSNIVLLEIFEHMYKKSLFTIKDKHYFDDMFEDMLEDNEIQKINFIKKYAPTIFKDIKRDALSAHCIRNMCKYRSEEGMKYALTNMDISDLKEESVLFNALTHENRTGIIELFFIASQCNDVLFNMMKGSERFCQFILRNMDYLEYEINSDIYHCVTSNINKCNVLCLLNKWVDAETQNDFQKEVIKFYLKK